MNESESNLYPLPGRSIISADQMVQNALDGLIRHGRRKRFARRGKQLAVIAAVGILLVGIGSGLLKSVNLAALQHYFDQLEMPEK